MSENTPKQMTPQERLEAVKAQRKALASSRSSSSAQRDVLDEIEKEELELANDTARGQAECELGKKDFDWSEVDTDLGIVIVKRPNPTSFRKFQDVGSFKILDLEKLVEPCLFYPDHDVFESWLDTQPFILTRAANAVHTLAGVRSAEASGK